MSNPVGRPRKYNSPEEMQVAIDKYFNDIKETKEPPTIMGLVEACKFEDRKSLIDYCGYDKDFLHTIKKAKAKVEKYIELQLMSGRNVAGLIFNLKNNFAWVDKQEIDTKITGEMSMIDLLSKPKQDKEDKED